MEIIVTVLRLLPLIDKIFVYFENRAKTQAVANMPLDDKEFLDAAKRDDL